MTKPKIAFVTWYNCTRVSKEATVLKQMGYDVTLITNNLKDNGLYSEVLFFGNETHLINAVKMIKDKIDIWQVHNEPSYMVNTIRLADPKAKILLDYHDSNYWRMGHIKTTNDEDVAWYEEDMAVGFADGFVVPSDACKIELENRTEQPIAVLPAANPLRWY